MLWIEYESSGILTKDDVRSIVDQIGDLVSPIPVVAEDWTPRGLGLIAYDGSSLEGSGSSQISSPVDSHSSSQGSSQYQTAPSDAPDSAENMGGYEHGNEFTGREGGGQGGSEGDDDDCHLNTKSNKNYGKTDGYYANYHGNGGGAPIDPDSQLSATSTFPPATFIGTVYIQTSEGLKQTLQVAFEPVISAQTSSLTRVENIISMERVSVTASRIPVLRNNPQVMLSNMERDGLPPFFTVDSITITVGVSGGDCFGPYDYYPKQDDFLKRRGVKRNHQWEIAIEGSARPKGNVMYNQGAETTQEMTTNTVGLWPSNFGSGLPGCKRWEYKVLESYKTNLECSAASPPVHKAKFSYDAASGCPDFLHIQVRTEFKLEKSRRYTLAEMKKTLWSSYIRHISVRLEAHVKRTEPHDFFIIPALNKSGAL
jgi:hypothetical protein